MPLLALTTIARVDRPLRQWVGGFGPALVPHALQYNCCGSRDFQERGCLTGMHRLPSWTHVLLFLMRHSDTVDDAELRGKSNDPRTVKDIERLQQQAALLDGAAATCTRRTDRLAAARKDQA